MHQIDPQMQHLQPAVTWYLLNNVLPLLATKDRREEGGVCSVHLVSPKKTISQRMLRPTCALDYVLRLNSQTKVIRFLRTFDAINSSARQFQTKLELPAALEALDGSLIPQKKPSAAQAGNDADAYWSATTRAISQAYCSQYAMQMGFFVYRSRKSRTVGDAFKNAGFWGRSDLWKQISERLVG
jgi:hypothetical protein